MGGRTKTKKVLENPSLKKHAPQLSEAGEYNRQKVESILRRRESLDSARELIGWDIVAATPEGVQRVRITKTRSFSGIGKSTTNRDGISREAGHVYIMKHRAAKFLNITTGRSGQESCVWIEEAADLKTGKTLKSNQLLKTLGLHESDGVAILTDKTTLVPGAKPDDVKRLSPSAERASTNTTGVFQGVFSGNDQILADIRAAYESYTG